MRRRAPAQGTAPSDGVPGGGEARGRPRAVRGPRARGGRGGGEAGEVAPNAVDRGSMRGGPPKAVSTGIACLPGRDGFGCPSGIIDYETGVVLAHVASDSMEGRLVLDTHDQPKGASLSPNAWSRSGRGAHCTARSPRERPAELGADQSMSRKACCWDDAPMESS